MSVPLLYLGVQGEGSSPWFVLKENGFSFSNLGVNLNPRYGNTIQYRFAASAQN